MYQSDLIRTHLNDGPRNYGKTAQGTKIITYQCAYIAELVQE